MSLNHHALECGLAALATSWSLTQLQNVARDDAEEKSVMLSVEGLGLRLFRTGEMV